MLLPTLDNQVGILIEYLMNGKLRIVRDGHVYDVTGIEVK